MWLRLHSADGLTAHFVLLTLFALQDVITQLGMFNDSLLSIPNHPWSSEMGSQATSLAPLDVYVWNRNQYTYVRPRSVARPWYLFHTGDLCHNQSPYWHLCHKQSPDWQLCHKR